MSFLNFLFRERSDRDEAPSPMVLDAEAPEAGFVDGIDEIDGKSVNATSVAGSDELNQQFEESVVYNEEPSALDLDGIRAALRKIAEVIHDDEEEVEIQEDLRSLSVVELTAGQIADLIPGVFKASAASEMASERTFGVRVADLFEQLRTGKVLTPMSRVLTEIPAEWLARTAQATSRDEVSIPLQLAVSAVRADELVKRTPSVERNPELKDMPNLFSMGGRAPAPRPTPKTDALFGAVPPRPFETTVKEPLPDSAKPGIDMFKRATESPAARAPAPPVRAPARGGKPGGFTFEFNEAATPFRRANEVKEEIAGEEATKATEAAAAKAPPAVHVPQAPPEPPAVKAKTEPSVSTPIDPFAPMPEVAKFFAPSPKPAPAPSAPPAAEQPVQKEEKPVYAREAPSAPKPAKPLTVLAGPTHGVQLHGVDVNHADADALVENVPGVGVRMAARIIRYRNQQGPFTCIQDLVNVPGIGPSTYEKMTGASWSEARDELRRTLDHLLGKSGTGIPDLRSVARRFANQPGFSGCILVHKDGHVLAGEWPDGKQQVVGAIAPQLFKKVAPYVDQLGFGEVNPITLCFGEDVLTLVHSGEIVIGTLHEIGRLDKNQLRLIQLAGAELEDRMERTKHPQDS